MTYYVERPPQRVSESGHCAEGIVHAPHRWGAGEPLRPWVCPGLTTADLPCPDPDLPNPGQPLKGPRLRLAYACWRFGVWDDRVREARAAFQGSLDEGTGGDVWWERHLNIALGKRALWQNRIDRYSV